MTVHGVMAGEIVDKAEKTEEYAWISFDLH
jgi:hypothetical protein